MLDYVKVKAAVAVNKLRCILGVQLCAEWQSRRQTSLGETNDSYIQLIW